MLSAERLAPLPFRGHSKTHSLANPTGRKLRTSLAGRVSRCLFTHLSFSSAPQSHITIFWLVVLPRRTPLTPLQFSLCHPNVLLLQIMEYTQSEAMLNTGMQVPPNPISVLGRLLPTPKIAFGGREIVYEIRHFSSKKTIADVCTPLAQQPNDDAWNLINQLLNLAQNLRAWAILNLADELSTDIASQFAGHLEICHVQAGPFIRTRVRHPSLRMPVPNIPPSSTHSQAKLPIRPSRGALSSRHFRPVPQGTFPTAGATTLSLDSTHRAQR